MHPIISEQIAWSRGAELRRRAQHHRDVARMRRTSQGSRTSDLRLALAGIAFRLARTLDRDGRVVPSLSPR